MPIAQPQPADEYQLPGENPASVGLPPRDHNRPPLDEIIPIEFRDELLRERPGFLSLVDKLAGTPELEGSVQRAKAEDDATAALCGDLDKKLRAAIEHVNVTHKAVKEPYLLGGRLVDAEKNALLVRLNTARATLGEKMNAFMAKREAERRAEAERIAAEQRAAAERAAQAERERMAAEEEARRAAAAATSEEDRAAAIQRAEEARKAAEDALASAALSPAAATKAEPIRSDAGATLSGRAVWNSKVIDMTRAFRAVKSDPKVKEAVEAAVARLVRAGQREIPGVEIWATTKAVAR